MYFPIKIKTDLKIRYKYKLKYLSKGLSTRSKPKWSDIPEIMIPIMISLIECCC